MNSFFTLFAAILTTLFSLVGFVSHATAEVGTKEYNGDWFSIKYPSNFVANQEGPDEASFTSPDGSVQFYVFSPMWSGNPVSYLEPLPTEKIESDKSVPEITPLKQENGTIYQKKVVRYITFAATDGSYKRSLVSTRSGLVRSPDSTNYGSETHYVLGIKYKNQKIYDQYLSSYLAFKNSLVAYAD